MADVGMLDQWLFWLLHAPEYEAAELLAMFPQEPIQTGILIRIAEQTEDKRMVDANEKAILNQLRALNASFIESTREGNFEVKMERIRIQMLQDSLGEPLSDADELCKFSLGELQAIREQLDEKVRIRDAKERAKEKAFRDELWFQSLLKEAYEKGYEQGYERSYAIKMIKFLDEVLGRAPSDTAFLETLSLEELDSMIAELKAQYHRTT